MPMHDIDLPAGYRIAEAGVPGAAPKHQVLRGSGRDQQLIGVRDNREEATQLAIRDNDRFRPSGQQPATGGRVQTAPCAAKAHGIHLIKRREPRMSADTVITVVGIVDRTIATERRGT